MYRVQVSALGTVECDTADEVKALGGTNHAPAARTYKPRKAKRGKKRVTGAVTASLGVAETPVKRHGIAERWAKARRLAKRKGISPKEAYSQL